SVEGERNTLYREVMSCVESRAAKDAPRWVGLPSSKGVRETERLWLVYREAFVQLVTKVRPDADIGPWRVWITEKRNDMLRLIRSEC
ncbi:MAG TPA: hypothetical protein VKP30_00205, partial [Polyangiaceae bacterium]|nr:hypothetical protein [Polyangiaceae bacterium]